MEEKRPSNGNALRDYRITQVEEAVVELKKHTRVLEDNLLRMNVGGITLKQLSAILVAVITALGSLAYGLLTLTK